MDYYGSIQTEEFDSAGSIETSEWGGLRMVALRPKRWTPLVALRTQKLDSIGSIETSELDSAGSIETSEWGGLRW